MTESEKAALTFLAENGGSVLVTAIPDKSGKDIFGQIEPGIRVYQKLKKQGLLIITEEEPDEEGFTFTPQVELTDGGVLALKTKL